MAILAAMAVPHPPLIMPEVGKGEEQTIQSTIDAYREVMRRAAVVLLARTSQGGRHQRHAHALGRCDGHLPAHRAHGHDHQL